MGGADRRSWNGQHLTAAPRSVPGAVRTRLVHRQWLRVLGGLRGTSPQLALFGGCGIPGRPSALAGRGLLHLADAHHLGAAPAQPGAADQAGWPQEQLLFRLIAAHAAVALLRGERYGRHWAASFHHADQQRWRQRPLRAEGRAAVTFQLSGARCAADGSAGNSDERVQVKEVSGATSYTLDVPERLFSVQPRFSCCSCADRALAAGPVVLRRVRLLARDIRHHRVPAVHVPQQLLPARHVRRRR